MTQTPTVGRIVHVHAYSPPDGAEKVPDTISPAYMGRIIQVRDRFVLVRVDLPLDADVVMERALRDTVSQGCLGAQIDLLFDRVSDGSDMFGVLAGAHRMTAVWPPRTPGPTPDAPTPQTPGTDAPTSQDASGSPPA